MDAIIIQSLTKKFGDFKAVDKVSFKVKQGELFGLLGPNGAGKTTTINMLSTLLSITSGTALIAEHNVAKKRDAVRRSIGIVFQDPALDFKLTGRENLDFHGRMYRLPKSVRAERIKEVLELVDLTERADALVETYSGGMKRRLEIARGLMHHPKVLFLDEPTLGLDAQTRRHIWDYIKRLNKSKKISIILTTHYMEEADYLCDRVAIIDHGKIVALDTPTKLKDVLGGDVVRLSVEGHPEELANRLSSMRWVKTLNRHDNQLSLTMEKGETRIPELISLAQKHKVKVKSVELHKPSLEDVFLHYTGKTIREHENGSISARSELIRRRRRQ